MTDWNSYLTEDRRLVLLRLLATQDGYSMNASVAQMALERLGHAVSRDRVVADFAWLHEQELVKREVVGGSVHVAKATQRGLDVADGRTIHPGVKRPGPG